VRPLYYNGRRWREKVAGVGFGKQMAHETEIKLRVPDLNGFHLALKRLGARKAFGGTGRVHEWNVLFDTSQNELGNLRQVLRIRTETPERGAPKRTQSKTDRVLLTFKRPAGAEQASPGRPAQRERHKVREEIELQVSDAAALTKIFEGLGLRGWFRYEKFRTTFRLPASQKWADGLLIELDETPIGTFAELEGPPKAIDRAARELGFSERDYIVSNYLGLYWEDCQRRGEKPSDMVFRKAK
jgi:adenylate cyclase class 2